MDLLPENIESFSKIQLRKYTKNLIYLYIFDNKHLYSIFFQSFKVKTIQYVIIGSRGKNWKSMYAHSLSFLDVRLIVSCMHHYFVSFLSFHPNKLT